MRRRRSARVPGSARAGQRALPARGIDRKLTRNSDLAPLFLVWKSILAEGRFIWAMSEVAIHLGGSALMTIAGIGTVEWLRG